MSEILSFKGNTPSGEPVPAVVETLEDLLERAKSGEFQGFAYAACKTPGDGFSTGWDGNGGTRDQLGAAVAHLHVRYFTGAYEDE